MPKALLFFYGSLKTGQANHPLIARERYIGPARTLPRFALYSLGRYPGLVHAADGGESIRGELWEVSECTVEELDDFEGSPDHYCREPIELEHVADPVESYFYQRPIPPGSARGTCWPFE